MLGRRVKVYDGSVRSASTSPGPLPASCDVAIVGAGAAGLMTAIQARQTGHARVVLLDGARTPGAKILVSGGSRCNVTNTIVTERDYWGGRRTIVRRILRAFPVSETVSFFEAYGVTLLEEEGGKLFPSTNRSRDVLDALLRCAADASVELHSGTRVNSVERPRGCVPDQHVARTTDRIIAGPGDRRSLASEDRQRRRGLRDRACVRSLHRRSDSRAGAAGGVGRRTIRDPPSARGCLARGGARNLDRRRGLNQPDRRAAVDAFRRQRSGRAECLPSLGSRGDRRARGPADRGFLSGAALRRRGRDCGSRAAGASRPRL